MTAQETSSVRTDVVIAGIGLGAIAAALALAERGLTVAMAGPERRVGGQITSQLTSPLDEHPLIETTGCTARFRTLRDALRAEHGGVDNPGGGWVSRLCFEPLVGEGVLTRMLRPHVEAGRISVHTLTRVDSAERDGDRIVALIAESAEGSIRFDGQIFIDATETGDILPLAAAEWVIGSEGTDAFGEPHALPGAPNPNAEQSCTIVAALVREESPLPVGPAPEGYAEMRDTQPFSLTLTNNGGDFHDYAMYDDTVAPGSFWSYRRVREAAVVGAPEAAIINWHGNDYYGAPLTAEPLRAEAEARRLTEAFVHWLRTEAPRDDGGYGHPELRLAPELSGTSDGFAETPYVRESRRLRSAQPITEHDLAPIDGDARARAYADSVGVAWYHADLHPRVGGYSSVYAPTSPFQLPLHALVGAGPVNLIAGAKNIAATQIAAAAYRIHPGEWAVGEAAGLLAARAHMTKTAPAAAAVDPGHILAIQVAALRDGAPIIWATDLPVTHPAFVAGSLLVAHGGLDRTRRAALALRPDDAADAVALDALRTAAENLAEIVGASVPATVPGMTWAQAANALAHPVLVALDETRSSTEAE